MTKARRVPTHDRGGRPVEGAQELLDWIGRTNEERYARDRVLGMIRREDDPSDQDLIEYLERPEGHDPYGISARDLVPAVVREYLERRRREGVKIGAKKGRRLTPGDEAFIVSCVLDELARLRHLKSDGESVRGGVLTTAYQNVAEELDVGWRRVQQLVRDADKPRRHLSARARRGR